MDIDSAKVNEAALALLYLTLHDGHRAWKGLAWEITDRLHAEGLLEDPANKSKSVVFTEKGLRAAESACAKLLSASGKLTAP